MMTTFSSPAIDRVLSRSSANAPAVLKFAILLMAFGIATAARADVVSTIISGSGGTGSVGPTGGLLTEPALNFTSNLPLDVTITVDSADRYYVSETTTFAGITGVENNTGVNWTGFKWQLVSSPAGSLVFDSSSPNFSGLDFTNTFSDATGTATLGTFSGGPLASGSYFMPAFKIDFPVAGTYVVRETPIPAPEPNTFILLALGTSVMFLWGRRRR